MDEDSLNENSLEETSLVKRALNRLRRRVQITHDQEAHVLGEKPPTQAEPLTQAELDELSATRQLTGRVLDSRDVLELRQLQHRVIAHINGGASGHIVENLRHSNCLRNGFKVFV